MPPPFGVTILAERLDHNLKFFSITSSKAQVALYREPDTSSPNEPYRACG